MTFYNSSVSFWLPKTSPGQSSPPMWRKWQSIINNKASTRYEQLSFTQRSLIVIVICLNFDSSNRLSAIPKLYTNLSVKQKK